jgi:hypothetical protein
MTISTHLDQARGAAVEARPWTGRAALAWARRRWLGLLYCALLALTLAPLAIWPIPPSWDLINHWARLTLYGMAPSDPLAALYQVRLTPIPDLAIDLANLVLSPLLPPQAVATLAWAASIGLPAWGAWRVGKALNGAAQPAILFAPLLSYNLVVTLGLVNFAIGMGLALFAFAAWLTIDRRRSAARLVLFNAISVALFFCHIAAYAALVLLVALYELAPLPAGERWRVWAKRNLLIPAHFLAGLALWALAAPIDARVSGTGSKLAAFAAPMFNETAEAGVLATLALVVALSAAALTRRVAFAPTMRWPLIGLAVVVALAPPAHGAADFIDARLAVLLAYVVIASLQGPRGQAVQSVAVALAVLALLARVGASVPHWAAYDAQAADFRQAIRVIPPGARALVVGPPAGRCPEVDAEDFARGLMNFVVIDRRALVSTLFTGQGMQPVAPRDPRLAEIPWTPPSLDWLARHAPDWAGLYDTMIALHIECDWRPDLAGWTPVAETAQATIYVAR